MASQKSSKESVETTWFFEHLLCMPNIPDEIVNHFGALYMPVGERSAGFRIPASVVARVMLRHLTRHVAPGDVPACHMLEIMGYVGALATQHSSHFRNGIDATQLVPPSHLLSEVAALALLEACVSRGGGDAAWLDAKLARLIDAQPLAHLASSRELHKRLGAIKDAVASCPPADLAAAAEALLPAVPVRRKVLAYAAAAQALLGPSYMQMLGASPAAVCGHAPYGDFFAPAKEQAPAAGAADAAPPTAGAPGPIDGAAATATPAAAAAAAAAAAPDPTGGGGSSEAQAAQAGGAAPPPGGVTSAVEVAQGGCGVETAEPDPQPPACGAPHNAGRNHSSSDEEARSHAGGQQEALADADGNAAGQLQAGSAQPTSSVKVATAEGGEEPTLEAQARRERPAAAGGAGSGDAAVQAAQKRPRLPAVAGSASGESSPGAAVLAEATNHPQVAAGAGGGASRCRPRGAPGPDGRTLSWGSETPEPEGRKARGERDAGGGGGGGGGVSSKRRRVGRWTREETERLIDAVNRHHRGNWARMLSAMPGSFPGRTQVDLKDKWRNLEARGLVRQEGSLWSSVGGG